MCVCMSASVVCIHICTLLGGGIPKDDDAVPDNWDAAESEEEVSHLT